MLSVHSVGETVGETMTTASARIESNPAPLSAGRVLLRGARAMFNRDLRLFLSYRLLWISQLVQILTTVSLFYFVSRLVNVPSVGSPDKYFAAVVVGIAVLDTLGATLVTMPVAVRHELVAGTFERLVVSPLGASGALLSMLVFPFLSSLVIGAITMLVAAALFGMPVQWSTAPLYVPLALLGAASFAPFAVLVTAAVLVVKQAGAGAGFILTGISLVGGFFFPVSLLPGAIRWMSDVQPFTPALELMRHVVTGSSFSDPVLLSLGKIALFAAVLLPISVMVLQRAIEFAQRRGTIIEY